MPSANRSKSLTDEGIAAPHIPVMLSEVLSLLDISDERKPLRFVDCTVGAGGHSEAMLNALSGGGFYLGLDRDENALAIATPRLESYLDATHRLVHSAFDEVATVLGTEKITGGLLADLGVSSMQLDEGERGFSFKADAPLDMRMDTTVGQSAAELLAIASEAQLADWFFTYGEERHSRAIAKRLVEERQKTPFATTKQLADCIQHFAAKKSSGERWRIHPATRVFQALRIAVNDELGQLERVLAALPTIMASGSVATFISFHSLEDRLVKHAFHDWERDGLGRRLTKKPLVATDAEQAVNPRSRSAKLRGFVFT
ncbi:MAG: 16S rRNA (cytosine(1402)-N(4))-methyltransferase RsmH [Vampirovibrionales bacterium]|nr:16S rRNA (cytosine(1402)-N(4))-methyltransferase RsmH [Vampirovibrionales bacterium]